ncbi:MAG TPA: molybdopterin molybdenumtransferase MoeA [Desulfofustis sp.]|jgi:molybdopterin molybdotransferase|nr:molybdopterin molybdotransferase MoeA [Desulfofustis sp. PB-SRB1]HBH28477.1 molybdopterin molybdenumtransferase MoeA [Desulfofustis sp.]
MQSPGTPDMLGRSALISVQSAQKILTDHLADVTVTSETVALIDGLDRILAEEIVSPENLPPFDRSTMDGFAVIAADTYGASSSMPAYLNVTGEVEMGKLPSGTVVRGGCFRIPTGGIIPDGADGVVMLEQSVPIDETMIEITASVAAGANIMRAGEDIRKEQPALAAGHLLRPQDIGLLAALGITQVRVAKPPTVAVISTGDEIVAYTSEVPPGKIRNSNGPALAALVRRAGGRPVDCGVVSDDETEFFAIIEQAITANDCVIFSGGSSVGSRDLGEKAVERLGHPGLLVHGVQLKPGKPILIGMQGAVPVFGLPGHPVSAQVCFELFVAPTIKTLMGRATSCSSAEPTLRAELTRNINSAAGRMDVVRVKIAGHEGSYKASPVLGKSGAISSLTQADGYFIIAENVQGCTAGTTISVYLYR